MESFATNVPADMPGGWTEERDRLLEIVQQYWEGRMWRKEAWETAKTAVHPHHRYIIDLLKLLLEDPSPPPKGSPPVIESVNEYREIVS